MRWSYEHGKAYFVAHQDGTAHLSIGGVGGIEEDQWFSREEAEDVLRELQVALAEWPTAEEARAAVEAEKISAG